MKARTGQVLIEVVIAGLVIVMVSLAVTELIASSAKEATTSKAETAATFVATEQQEASRATLIQNWNLATTIGTSSINQFAAVASGSAWTFQTGSASTTLNTIIYTYYDYFTDVYRSTSTGAIVLIGGYYDPSTIKVNTVVTWTDNFGNPLSYSTSEYLSRFYNKSYSQTDWSGGAAGDVVTTVATTTYATSSNIDAASTPGSFQLASMVPILLVQSKQVSTTNAQSVNSATTSLTLTSGNLLVVALANYSEAVTSTTISDSKGSTFALAGPIETTALGGYNAIFYAKNVSGGSDTVTASFNNPGQSINMEVMEFSGLSVTSPLDTATGATGSGSAPTTSSMTPGSAVELLIGTATNDANPTMNAGVGFTLVVSDNASGHQALGAEYLLTSSTSSVTANFSMGGSTTWAASGALFKQ